MGRKMTDEEYRAKIVSLALGAKHDKIPPPPRGWFEEHKRTILEEHPDYDGEKINAAVGRIWFKIYSDERREAAIVAEALHET